MPKLNPFRVSFDSPLEPKDRSRARLASTAIAGTALFLGVLSVGTLLNASSETIGTWSNASPEPEVRILAREGENHSGKPCDEQTWPYIEQRCLKRADPKTNERTTPKHGLGSQQVALPAGSRPANAPQVVPVVETGTTGSAPPDDNTQTNRSAAPQPAVPAVASPPPAISTDAAQQRQDTRPLSRKEQRRLQREERVRIQRERREEARRVREERSRARADDRRRNARDDQRIVRRWTEYTYRSPDGRSRRVVVIRRGSLDDDFFRNVR